MACGEAKAVSILKGVTTDKEAAQRIYEAYYEYYRTDATERFMEQAYLLWMQRSYDAMDVQVFLHETCGLKIKFTSKQEKIVQDFIKQVGEL